MGKVLPTSQMPERRINRLILSRELFNFIRSNILDKMPANEIIPNLWLGNEMDAKDAQFILRNHVSVVVNCTPDVPFLEMNSITFRYRIPLKDINTDNNIVAMVDAIRNMMPIIHKHYTQGCVILIHCVAGIQRSAIITLSYLYQYHACNFFQALRLIKQVRPYALAPKITFAESFMFVFRERLLNECANAKKNKLVRN